MPFNITIEIKAEDGFFSNLPFDSMRMAVQLTPDDILYFYKEGYFFRLRFEEKGTKAFVQTNIPFVVIEKDGRPYLNFEI